MKKCSVCKIIKEEGLFYKHRGKPDGLSGCCKKCDSARHKHWRQKYPDKVQVRNEKKRLRYGTPYWKMKSRESQLKRYYNLTIEQYNIMLTQQSGVCKICGRVDADATGRKLFVDHNHVTGKVRGLLCARCNGLVAFFEGELSEKVQCYLNEF